MAAARLLSLAVKAMSITSTPGFLRRPRLVRRQYVACSLYEQTDSAIVACCPVGAGYSFSGVNPNIFGGDDRGTEGAKGGRVWKGCSPSHNPLPRIFFSILDLKMAICGAFLVQFFCTSATTLEGAKSYSRPGIFLLGGQLPHSPLPPGSTPLYSFIALPRLAAVELNAL